MDKEEFLKGTLEGHSLEELELIYNNQKDLYSPKELEEIRKKISQLKGIDLKKGITRICPKCGGENSCDAEKCRFCDYSFNAKKHEKTDKKISIGVGKGWITFFRAILWVALIGFIILGIYLLDNIGGDSGYELGFVAFLVCVLIGLFSFACGMMVLTAMENLRKCATNSALILELLQKDNKC